MEYKIGEYFVNKGHMTPPQVETVLRAQKMGDKCVFGVIAMRLGYITEDILKEYVAELEKALALHQ